MVFFVAATITFVASVAVVVASVVAPIVATIAAVVTPIVATVAAVVGPIVATIGSIISTITTTIAGAVAGITEAISATLGPIVTQIKTVVTSLVEGLKVAIESIAAVIDTATAPILNPIKDALSLVQAKLAAVDAWMVAELKVIHDVIQIANAAATVKLLVDLVKGTASITEVIDKVAEGKSFETAVAIAQLSKSIVTLGVGMVDRIDSQLQLIDATFTTWDEQFKRELALAIDIQKAELLSVVTPKLDVLGDHQLRVNRKVARLWRHIEDEAWFTAMFLRMLR